MRRYYILLLFFITIISCKQVDNPKVDFLKWAQKGAVTNKIICKNDPSQSYCLFLPSNYDVNKNYPTIYAFDPHGKGRIPVVFLKGIAEKLGYIVIGSNNSKNGLSTEEINTIVNALFADSQQKLAIDPSRIYLLGFSGGARIACMTAQRVSGINGVIACSAGFQPTKNPLGFRFIGIAGTQDMNYFEMRHLNNFMDSVGIQNQLIEFKGKHEWPKESTLTEAINMLEIYEMPNPPLNRNLADEYMSKNLNRIQQLKDYNSSDSLALAYSIAKRTFQMLNGLVDVESIKTTIDELIQQPNLQKYLKDKVSLERFESNKQREYASSFGSKSETWWRNEIQRLNDGSAGLRGDVYKRLLGYISLSCYSYVNNALHYQDWRAAKYFTSIYMQVDPEIPDSWYALACLQANTGKLTDAIESLKKAIKFGFSDFSKMQNDPIFTKIRGLTEFKALIKQ